ncbi:MAG: hypothetical protein WD751_11770 [Anaerolineales bacterium]
MLKYIRFFSRSLGLLQVLISIGAIAGGLNFLRDTSGAGSGFTREQLNGTPFSDYLIPGLYLLLVGAGTLAAAWLSLLQHPWSAELAIGLGLALMGWITAQIFWLGYLNWMQPFYFVLGLLEGGFGACMQRFRDAKALAAN